jgi:hypothetical protein
MADDEQLDAGIERYNRADYLGAQELFESASNSAAAGEPPLARALLMLSCAMHLHFHRGGGRGTLNLIRQSLLLLDDLRPECRGVATGELYEQLEAYLQDLQERKKPGAGFFDRWLAPKISRA